MTSSPRPTFGKRGAPDRSRIVPKSAETMLAVAPEHAATLARMRRELSEHSADDRPMTVNLSMKAAFLAALVVGCCLAGFDVAGQGGPDRLDKALALLGLDFDPRYLTLGLALLGLVGGARAATMTILVVHAVLRRMNETSPIAYAIGGAVAAALFSGVLFVAVGHVPAHGWLVDLGAGAGSGFFYRMFAGARRAEFRTA